MTSPLNDAFRALASPERREILTALAEHSPQPDPSFNYRQFAPVESGDSTEKKRAKMYHSHLPMLEAAEFIQWHKGGQEITKGSNFNVIQPLLLALDEAATAAN
jgi:hypothetical protein